MNEELKKYYDYLKSAKADVPDNYDSFAETLSDEAQASTYFNYLKSNNFDTPDTFESFSETLGLKKKDLSVSPLESAAKGETILQDFGLPSKEPIAPKLPYQQPQKTKVTQEETLAEGHDVSSVLKAQQKLPEYFQEKQNELVKESIQSINDELSKLDETYKQKAETNPEKSKELQKEYESERKKVIELRSANIPIAVENLYKKGKEYKWLDPTDVKELSKLAREISNKPTDFIKKKDELEGIRRDFMSKVGTLTPEEQDAISKELGDVISQNSILNEEGAPSVYGWKQEVLSKQQGIQRAFDKLKADNPKLENIGTDYAVRASDKGKELLALIRANDMYDRVLSLPDDKGSFIEGFKSQGKAMLTAGMSDLFEAAHITKVLKKQSNGDELTIPEQAIVDAYGIYNTAQSSDQFGKAYSRGQGIAGSVAFMETFALTGGLASVGEKTALKLLGNQVKNKVVQNIVKGIGGAAVRTPLLVGGATDAVKRIGGTPKLNKEGEWKVDPATVEPVMQAIGKGLYSNFANALGETAGGWLAGTGVSKVVSKGLGINKIPKSVTRVFNAIGMQPLGELPEEYLTTLMETPVMGDQTLKEAFSAENVWETAVQVGMMSGFFSGIALPSVINENVKRARNKEMIDLFGKDKIAEIRNAIENKDKGAFASALGDLTESTDIEKKQLLKYANLLAHEQGVKVSQEAAKIANEEENKATETTDKGTATTEVGALEVPQEVADQKTQETPQSGIKETKTTENIPEQVQHGAITIPKETTKKVIPNNTTIEVDRSEIYVDGKSEGEVELMTDAGVSKINWIDLKEKKGQGHGRDLYYTLRDQARASGNELISDNINSMTDASKGLWQSLVKKGEAELIGNHYMFSDAPNKAEVAEKASMLDFIRTTEIIPDLSLPSDKLEQAYSDVVEDGMSRKDFIDKYKGDPDITKPSTTFDELNDLSFAFDNIRQLGKNDKEILDFIKKSFTFAEENKIDKKYGKLKNITTAIQESFFKETGGDIKEGAKDPMGKATEVKGAEVKNNFDLREKLLTLQQKSNETTGKEQRGVTEIQVGGSKLGGKVASIPSSDIPRFDVRRSEGTQRKSTVKEFSISDKEASDILSKVPSAVFDKSFSEINDINEFHSAIIKAKLPENNKFGSSVFAYTPNEYKNSRLFITNDGKAGLAITKDGTIISVFSYGEGKGRVPQLIMNAIKEGGVKLDHYNTKLTEYYSKFGFIPVAKVRWDDNEAPSDWNKKVYEKFNNGEPDVIAMVYHGGDVNTLSERFDTFGSAKDMVDNTPYVKTWDEAMLKQLEYVDKIKAIEKDTPPVVNEAKKPPMTPNETQLGTQTTKEVQTPTEETKAVKEPDVPKKGEKQTGFEKRETKEGTKGSIEKRNDEIGKIVKRIVDDNPHFYETTTVAEEIEKAKDFISSFASFNNALANLLKKTKNIDDLTMRHVARQIMMQKLGEDLRDAMKTGDKQSSDAIADDIVKLEDITQKELRVSATTLRMTLWQLLTPEASVFMVNRVINEANRIKLGFEGKQAEDFINKWNEEVPESVKRLLTENPELRDFVDKIKAKADKIPPTQRTTKAKAKVIATKVRALKSSNWGLTFADPIGATAILDGALEVTARTIETTGNILQSIQDGITEIQKSDWYKSLTAKKQKEVDKTYNDKVRKEVDFDAAEYIEGQSWYTEATAPEVQKDDTKKEKSAQRQKNEADKRLKERIFDIIASHWLVEKEGGESLTDKLVRELGLTKKEAEKIASISEEAVRRDSQKIFESTLGKKIPNKQTKKSAFDKFFKLIQRGVLTNENFYEIFAKDYKLKTGLTVEEKTKLQELAVNAQVMSPYGYFGDIAFDEFAQYMAKVTEQESWISRQSTLMVAANYSRILSGVTTHKVNLTSAGINLLIRPFFGTLNPIKWGKSLYNMAKGDMKQAHLDNPFAALTYALGAYRRGMEIGGATALNIVRNGNVKEASKYMESVNNLSGQKIPPLEKNTFGIGKAFKPWSIFKFKAFGKTFLSDVNPWNAMKYSGRTLLAEDAAMFNTAFALELAMATRRNLIESGKFSSMKELKNTILNEIIGRNLTEEQNSNIEQQLEEQTQMLRTTGVEPTSMQIKQRRFELTRTLLELTPEEIEESTQLARDAIFTNDRAGIFSVIGDAMGRLFGKNIWIKMATMPKIPFTGVLGRIADMGLDTMPVYGLIRAKGWSPTSIIARMRQAERTRQLKDFWVSPAKAGLFKTAQMGEKGSALQERQMARAYFGLTTIATIASIFLTSDDDDKDKEGHPWIDITGGLHYHDWNEKEKHYMGAYTAKIGNRKFRYLNYPILNTPFAIVGNYKDALKAGEANDDFIARLSLLGKAWFESLGLVKDTWLAKGINDIFEMVGGLISSFGGDDKGRKQLREGGTEIIDIDGRVQRQLENLRDDYTGLPIKYIDPLKSNMLQQIMKFATPESRLKGTGQQLLAYNLGLQWWNDKRTDIFGQEVKTLPGDQGTAWPRASDDRWDKMWKYNIHIRDISAKDKLKIKGVPQTLEWDQYIERKGLTQELFKDRFDNYFETTPEKELQKKAEKYVIIPPDIKVTQADKDIRDIWTDTKADVKNYMFVWDKQVKDNKKLFDFLLKEGVLPKFSIPQLVNEDGEKILVPYDKLEAYNDKIMKAFIPDVSEWLNSLSKEEIKTLRETVYDEKTGETELENWVKWFWDAPKDDETFYLKSEMGVW